MGRRFILRIIMNTTSFTFPEYFKLLLLLAAAIILHSCGASGPSIKAVSPAAIITQQQIPDDELDEDPIIESNNGVTVLRYASKTEMTFYHYAPNSLAPDSSISIAIKKGDHWSPLLHTSKGILHAIGVYSYSDDDSSAVRAVTIDLASHRLIADKILQPLPIEHLSRTLRMTEPEPTRSNFSKVAVSQDSSLILFTQDDYSGIMTSHNIHTVVTRTFLYDLNGTLIDSLPIPMKVPDAIESTSIEKVFRSIAIDNSGNRYLIRYLHPDSIVGIQYNAKTHSHEQLAARFTNIDTTYQAKSEFPIVVFDNDRHILKLALGRKINDDEIAGVMYAEFNFPVHTVRSFQYDPNSDLIKLLANNNTLSSYYVSDLYSLPTKQRTIIALRKREDVIEAHSELMSRLFPGSSGHTNYLGRIYFGFDADGKPVWQNVIQTDQDKSSIFQSLKDSSLLVEYYREYSDLSSTRDLFIKGLNIQSGVPTRSDHAIECASGTYFKGEYTAWLSPDTALLVTCGSMGRLWRNYVLNLIRLPKPTP
jgi:hypothetical protein